VTHLFFRWLGVLRCPQCGGKFDLHRDGKVRALRCRECGARYEIAPEMPRLLLPQRENEIKKFCAQYDALRLQEGWASELPEFYLHLPFRDLSARHPKEWLLRAESLRWLQDWLKNNFSKKTLRILDIGAGSGWMSQRLSELHQVLAIDVNAGPHGLSALPVEQRQFMAAQAELENLPLASNSFDVAIANASLHYTQHLKQVFGEISRVLRPGGKLIVMDSPTYPTLAAVLNAHERTKAYYTQMEVPELANNYAGLLETNFLEQPGFRFTRRRRDFTGSSSVKKWLLEKMGKATAARFPIWVGERLCQPEENWQPGRQRAGALIIQHHKLLTYHFKNEKKEYWRIPGGGIEPNETPEQAAQRELHEELNLPITIQRQFGPYFRANKSEWYFLAEADQKKMPVDYAEAPEDFGKIDWLPLEKLAECDLRPAALKWELVDYFNS